MLKSTLLAIFFLALVSGSKLPQKAKTKTTKAEPCCLPDQLEGIVGMSVGTYNVGDESPGVVEYLIWYSYDAVNQRVAYSIGNDLSGVNPPHSKFILDWQLQRQYVISIADDTCTVSDLIDPFTRSCIPSNATKVGEGTYGAGETSLGTNIWQYEAKNENGENGEGLEVFFTTTKTTCTAVGQGLRYLSSTVNLVMGVGYAQTTVGIADDSIFDPPASCTKETTEKQPYQDSDVYKFIKTQHPVNTRPLGAKPIHPKNTKNICCAAEVYEGTAAMIEGVYNKDPQFVAGIWIFARLSYDGPNQRMASVLDINSGDSGNRYKSIYDWNSRRAYLVDEGDNTCTYTEITSEFQRVCIPDDATNLGRSFIGSANETLPYNAYSFDLDYDPDNQLQVMLTATDQCQFATERLLGTQSGTQILLYLNFFNETNTISDPGIYDPPADCVPAKELTQPGRLSYLEMRHNIKTRVPKKMESREENEV